MVLMSEVQWVGRSIILEHPDAGEIEAFAQFIQPWDMPVSALESAILTTMEE